MPFLVLKCANEEQFETNAEWKKVYKYKDI